MDSRTSQRGLTMIQERDTGRIIASCDRCRFASPYMDVGTRTEAATMLRAAGWSIRGHAVLCPRCTALEESTGAGRET
jgi:hypothetical protein